jgi:hypothetical protein
MLDSLFLSSCTAVLAQLELFNFFFYIHSLLGGFIIGGKLVKMAYDVKQVVFVGVHK